MKSLEFSSDFFVTHKLLIQICSMNLDVMIKNIHLMEKEIKQDQETQDAYLTKRHCGDILQVFERVQQCFETMMEQKFKPNQTMFAQLYRMSFKFAKLYNECPAWFDHFESDPLQPFHDWLVAQMKQHGLK